LPPNDLSFEARRIREHFGSNGYRSFAQLNRVSRQDSTPFGNVGIADVRLLNQAARKERTFADLAD